MYQLISSKSFSKKFKKLIKNNKQLEKQILKTLNLLRQSPFYPSLKTHKVIDVDGDHAFSSWVNTDLRVLWDFVENEPRLIDLIDLGGHSGSNKVYK